MLHWAHEGWKPSEWGWHIQGENTEEGLLKGWGGRGKASVCGTMEPCEDRDAGDSLEGGVGEGSKASPGMCALAWCCGVGCAVLAVGVR